MDEYTLENGHTVSVGDRYTMNYDNVQQGIPEGAKLTVYRITRQPDGVHIEFACEFIDCEPMEAYTGNPTTIMAFAMTNLLNDGKMA